MVAPRTSLAGLQSIVYDFYTSILTHTKAVTNHDKFSTDRHFSEYNMCLQFGCPKQLLHDFKIQYTMAKTKIGKIIDK